MSTIRDINDLLFGTTVSGFGARWRVWSARRAHVTSANALATGHRAKVVGLARALETEMRAPFTQRLSLAWRAKLEEKELRTDGRHREVVYWNVLLHETSALPFVLEDESGQLIVDPRHAILAFDEENVKEHPHVNDDNPELRELLRRRGYLTTMYMGIAGDRRFLEGVIVAGERLAVWGRVEESASVASSGYRDAAVRAHVLRGTAADPIVVFRPRQSSSGSPAA